MEEQKFSFSESFNKSKEYLETQVELAKLKAISRMSRIFGSLILDVSKVLLSLLIVFFVSLALGFYLGEILGSYSLGFLTTGGIFFIILLIIRALEPKLEAKFMNLTIKRILAKWDDEDEPVEEKINNPVENNSNPEVETVDDQVESQQHERN
ncbi:hypothetical protein ACFRAE_14425 [Sphingobacterium sp. HJSM2_6]|uniref:hypothetical protein n=1 Tax=Sphingobacterium sp. HJSM2_6 TaxID=3366264 RepID=UPI003BBCC5F8